MSADIFDSFDWHSSIGIDQALKAPSKVVKMPWNIRASTMFVAAGNDLLVHKTTKCLWRMSQDKKSIEPVFENDVLSAEDVTEAMEGGTE